MNDQPPPTREELMLEMRAGQERVLALVNDLGPETLAQLHDTRGWTAKDHLAHLNAWERAFISWLEGGTRAEGLGIAEDLWDTRDIDAINEAVRELHASDSIEDILDELDRNRRHLVHLVEAMSDADLARPYSHYPSADPAIRVWTAASRAQRVTGSHVDEHIGYIRRMTDHGG